MEGRLALMMEAKTVRAFHYSRLTDREVELIRGQGVQPTSTEFLRERLDGLIGEGVLAPELADVINCGSPLHSQAYGVRLGMFWMTAVPAHPADPGVELLLASWGGESAYWCVTDDSIAEVLRSIGRPRVIEIAVRLSVAAHRPAYQAATCVLSVKASELGFPPDRSGMDLCVTTALPPEQILAVHTEGEESFHLLHSQAMQSSLQC